MDSGTWDLKAVYLSRVSLVFLESVLRQNNFVKAVNARFLIVLMTQDSVC